MTTAQDLVNDALRASERDDVEQALSLLRQAQTAAPGWHVPSYLMGAEFAQAQRHDEAEAAFASALLLAPQFEMVRFQLGLLQFNAGRVALAMVTWQPLAEGASPSALGLFAQGFAALAQQEVPLALQFFTQGLAADLDNAPLNADIRRVMQRLETQAEDAAVDVHAMLANYQRGYR